MLYLVLKGETFNGQQCIAGSQIHCLIQGNFVIKLLRKININSQPRPVCAGFAHTPCVCVGFLWGLQCPPESQRCACELNGRLPIGQV